MSIKGTIQVSGVYKTGEIFMQDVNCPFKAEVSSFFLKEYVLLDVQLVVPKKQADAVLAGLESGASLTLDGVPSLVERL